VLSNLVCNRKIEPCGLDVLTSVGIGFGFGIEFFFVFFSFFSFFLFKKKKFYDALTDL
jgi:hypothetical protein